MKIIYKNWTFFWFAFLATHIYKEISQQTSLFSWASIFATKNKIMISISYNYFSRVCTTFHRNVTWKFLSTLSTLLHQQWIIVRLSWTPITTIFLKSKHQEMPLQDMDLSRDCTFESTVTLIWCLGKTIFQKPAFCRQAISGQGMKCILPTQMTGSSTERVKL